MLSKLSRQDLPSNGKLKIDETRSIVKKCLKVLLAHLGPRSLGFENRGELGSAFLVSRQGDGSGFISLAQKLVAKRLDLLACGLKCFIGRLDFSKRAIASQLELRIRSHDVAFR